MQIFLHGLDEVIPTDAPLSDNRVQHVLYGQEIDRGPTVDGLTSVVIQGKRPGELVFKILEEPFIQTQPKSSSAPYSAPSAEPVKKAA